MRVMLDHCTPAIMRRYLPEHEVFTAAQMGWQTHQNGQLIAEVEAAGFDTFVTSDQNIPNQVSMRNRQIAIIVLTSNTDPVARHKPMQYPKQSTRLQWDESA